MLIGLLACALFAWLVMYLFNSLFSQSARDNRAAKKVNAEALTAARKRSILAEQALREIAAGAELPIWVAEDALRQINNTYIKEIQ